LLAAFAGGLGLLLAEGLLRATGMVSPSPYRPDPICGTRLKSNFSGAQNKEGETSFRTNSAGFRDREHARAKPPGTLRIVVLGDSYSEALQVDLDQAFWSVLQRELNQCPRLQGRQVEVLNAGVSGYGTAQELLMLRHYLWDYDPDVVLLAFLSGNDVRNNSRQLDGDPTRPYFVLQDGELALDDSFARQPIFTSPWIRFKDRLIGSSRLLTLLYRWKHRPKPAVGTDALVEPGLDSFIYDEPREPRHREAWEVTERLIEEMQREAESHGASLVIATLSNGIQVHPDPTVRQQFAERLGVADLYYPERRLVALAERLGCRAIVLADRLRQYAEEKGVYLHGFENATLGQGHWNTEGHHLAGQIIAEQLCADAALGE